MAYYNSTNSSERRNAVLSSVNKMNYICEALENNGYNTEIVSASGATEKKFCKSKKLNLQTKLHSNFFIITKIKQNSFGYRQSDLENKAVFVYD